MRPSSVILWEGPSAHDGAPLVLIATGLGAPSANRKTGPMVQTYILRADVGPLAALASGADASICGACPLRGFSADGVRQQRACYVNVGQSVESVWRAYARGSYPRVNAEEGRALLAGRSVRLGAYGDPAMVPFDIVAGLMAEALPSSAGYTHRWRTTDPRWSGLLMASADGAADHVAAQAAGWRSFAVLARGASLPSGTVECAATRPNNPLQCIDCGMCAGTRGGTRTRAVSVAILAHGAGAKYVVSV